MNNDINNINHIKNKNLSFTIFTFAMSSLCFPWFSNKDKILSNKICSIFVSSKNKKEEFQSISPSSEMLIDACLAQCVCFCPVPIWCDFDKLRLPLKMQSPGQRFF